KTRVSLQDIAKATGIPKSSLANYLSGRTLVPPDQLDAIARALGASAVEAAALATLWDQVADRESAPRTAGGRVMPVLVSRDSELGVLRGMVAGLRAGQGRAVLVEGEPGIGKSTLLHVVAGTARAEGAQVFWAACDELSQAFPLLCLRE